MLQQVQIIFRKFRRQLNRKYTKIQYRVLGSFEKRIPKMFLKKLLRKKSIVKALLKCDVDGGVKAKTTLKSNRLVRPLFTEKGNMHFFLCHTSKRILIINSSPKEHFFFESDVVSDFELITKNTTIITLKSYYKLEFNKCKKEGKKRGESELRKNIKAIYQQLALNQSNIGNLIPN